MKGVILAGGLGTRLKPLTDVINKHLLPIGNKPMILHAISRLVDTNITDILIVTGPEDIGKIAALCKSGRSYGCNLTYKIQDEPDGIAGALSLAKDFVGDDNLLVLLGDNIFENSIKDLVKDFKERDDGRPICRLLLTRVPDPERFGVVTIKNDAIVKIIEKPKSPETNLVSIGAYIYTNKVFDIIKDIPPSARGEYEVTDINTFYIEKGHCEYRLIDGWWLDVGEFNAYVKVNNLLWSNNDS